MPGIFDGKLFNAEVFKGYVDRLPNPNKTELIKSRAIRPRPDLAQAMADQDGGNYITTTLRGLISGTTPQNYDGATNIVPSTTTTFSHSRVVVGRMSAWTEKDFSYDVTGGEEFIENVAEQISQYWDEIDQGTIISILTGVFNMSDTEGAKFVESHTLDVSGMQNSEGKMGYMDGTTLNTCMQRACGDGKGKFSLTIMHSTVATNLENLKLLVYLKYNDGNGIERELALGTLNGRLVMVDDSMPTIVVSATAGVYKVKLTGTWAENDTLTVAGHDYTVVSGSTSAAAIATAVAALFADDDTYTATASSGTITLTEKTGMYGAGAPDVDKTSTSGVVTVTTTTQPIAEDTVKYVTFALGDGAIEYTDCGAKVPYEVDRDPKTNGGQDTLYSRQRKCFAPFGISFTKAVMSTLSPSDAELRNGANWELVNNLDSSGKQYINHKTIPIARIISLG